MDEDKRKSARTQGRFSGGDREYSSRRQDKSSKTLSGDKNKGEKRKAPIAVPRTKNKIDLQYDKKSNYSFKEIETVRKPEVLRFDEPIMELSKTDNGVSRLLYDLDFMKIAEADEYMTILHHSTVWHDKNIVIRGVEHPQPRLVAWYGPHPYAYAGATLEAREMTSTLREIKEKVEAKLRQYDINVELNSVLLNLYRNEKDSVAWHSDDESTLGISPTIASVSLGETRKFELRPRGNVKGINTCDILYVNLTHGSLIVMDGCMQKDWQHRVPKEYHDKQERINLTFRTIYPIDQLPPEMPRISNLKSAKTLGTKVFQQQNHKFDQESFPPLGMEVNDKKSKRFPKENGNKDNQQLASPRKYQKEENWDNEMLQGVEGLEVTLKNQNIFNKMSSPEQIVISPELHPSQTDINSNIKESAKLCNMQFISSDLIKSEGQLDCSETCQSHIYESNEGNSIESKNISPSKSKPETAEISNLGKKYMLNADAPDFIPQKKFEKYSLSDFAQHCYNLKSEDLQSFAEALFECIEKNESHFSNRDFYELEVYAKLKKDGSISNKHLKIILERIGSMISNAFYKKNETRYRNSSRSFDDNNYHKHRQSYVRSSRY